MKNEKQKSKNKINTKIKKVRYQYRRNEYRDRQTDRHFHYPRVRTADGIRSRFHPDKHKPKSDTQK